MDKKVLFLENPYYGKPWKDGIESEFKCEVDLTDNLSEALNGIKGDQYGLVIVEPWIFDEPDVQKNLISLLKEAKRNSVRVMISSSQSKDGIKERWSLSDEIYGGYHSKVEGTAQGYYDMIGQVTNENIVVSHENIVEYVKSTLAAKGITKDDYSDTGSQTVNTRNIHLVSEVRKTLKKRGGIEFEYGYFVTDLDLKPEIDLRSVEKPSVFQRNMPFNKTDTPQLFSGDRTYFVSLIDEATGGPLCKVEVFNGKISKTKTDFDDNEFYLSLKGVRKGDSPYAVLNSMIASYLTGKPTPISK